MSAAIQALEDLCLSAANRPGGSALEPRSGVSASLPEAPRCSSSRKLLAQGSLRHDGRVVRTRVFAGLGLVAVGVFLPLAFILEFATRPAGSDGDNATDSLLYLQKHGTAYALSGCCLVLAALGLIRAATAVPWRTPFLTAVGSVAAGLWAFTGALRISSPGPIDHIRGYDEDWGETAYLVVQMAGTQGGLLAGVALTEFWIVTGCLLAWRAQSLPRPLCAIGMVALVYPLTFVPSYVFSIEDGLWVLGIISLVVGLPAWFLASGIWALVTGASSGPSVGQTAPA